MGGEFLLVGGVWKPPKLEQFCLKFYLNLCRSINLFISINVPQNWQFVQWSSSTLTGIQWLNILKRITKPLCREIYPLSSTKACLGCCFVVFCFSMSDRIWIFCKYIFFFHLDILFGLTEKFQLLIIERIGLDLTKNQVCCHIDKPRHLRKNTWSKWGTEPSD